MVIDLKWSINIRWLFDPVPLFILRWCCFEFYFFIYLKPVRDMFVNRLFLSTSAVLILSGGRGVLSHKDDSDNSYFVRDNLCSTLFILAPVDPNIIDFLKVLQYVWIGVALWCWIWKIPTRWGWPCLKNPRKHKERRANLTFQNHQHPTSLL